MRRAAQSGAMKSWRAAADGNSERKEKVRGPEAVCPSTTTFTGPLPE